MKVSSVPLIGGFLVMALASSAHALPVGVAIKAAAKSIAPKSAVTAGDVIAGSSKIISFKDEATAHVFGGKVKIYGRGKNSTERTENLLTPPDRKLPTGQERPLNLHADRTNSEQNIIELLDGKMGSGNGGSVRWTTKGELQSISMESVTNGKKFNYGVHAQSNGKYSIHAKESSVSSPWQQSSAQSEFALEPGEILESVTKVDFVDVDKLKIEILVVKNGVKSKRSLPVTNKIETASASAPALGPQRAASTR